MLVPVHVLNYVYDHTMNDCHLQQYFVEKLSMNVLPRIFDVQSENHPHAALIDIAKAFTKSPIEEDTEKSLEEFHVPISKD